MSKVQKYIHSVLNHAECRWKGINLYNLAAEMSADELKRTQRELGKKLVAKLQAEYDTLVTKNAPAIILDNYGPTLEKAKKGKHPHLNVLAGALRKKERNNV